MIVHEHDSDTADGTARGADYGRRFAREIAAAAAAYRVFFREAGLSEATVARVVGGCDEALTAWAPRLAEEITAVADGAGVPRGEVLLLNARTEVIVAQERAACECSTLVRAPADGRPGLATQTWDWAPRLVPDAVLWRYRTERAWVKTFTEPGMLAKIGVNGLGLAVHFNHLRHVSDTTQGAVPVHAVARRILDEAGSVDEAVAIARSAPVSASSVVTVVSTAAGSEGVAALEISPAGVGVVEPDGDGWLPHTNHFLDEVLAEGDVVDPLGTTWARLEHLRAVLTEDLAALPTPELAARLCGPHGARAPVCVREDPARPPTERWRTMCTLRLHPREGMIDYRPGSPHELATAGRSRRF